MYELVSIITPSFNTALYIKQTIDSVLSQTYQNWELLIVDDCSTDGTDEVLTQYTDSRIHYFKNVKNQGAALSRNYALRVAKGKWIAFLDSDDLWFPEKLEKQIRFMEENKYYFTYTDYCILTSDGKIGRHVITGPNKVTKCKLYNYCYLSTLTVMYDREVIGLIQIGDIQKNNDYAMWFQAIKKADCFRFPECLSCYRKRENSISSGNKIKLIKYHYLLYCRELKKSKIIAVLLTCNNLFFGACKKLFYKKKYN